MVIRRPVFRVPCLNHTLSLAQQDALKSMFLRVEFFADMMLLFETLPKRKKTDTFSGLHSPCPTRWLSSLPFLEAVVNRNAEISAIVTAANQDSPEAPVTRHCTRIL
jgi:hypothetical protein